MATLRSKMLAVGTFALIGSATIAFTGLWGIHGVTASTEGLMTSYVQANNSLKDIDRDVREIRFRVAAVSLDQLPSAGSANHLKEARTNITTLWKHYKASAQPIAYPKEQLDQIAQIEKGLEQTAPAIFDRIAAAYKSDDKATLNALLESDLPIIQSSILKPMERLIPFQNEAIKVELDNTRQLSRRALIVSFIALAIVASTLLGTGLLFARRINSALRTLSLSMSRMAEGNLSVRIEDTGSDEFSALARDLSAAATHLRDLVGVTQHAAVAVAQVADTLSAEVRSIVADAEQQAQGIAAFSTAMDGITQSANATASLAEEAESAVRSNADSAAEGNRFMAANVNIADRTSTTMVESIQAVKRLAEANQTIGSLSESIRAIADQTNLLALNAAIEAARAGEQGRGFAVVADEVRKLAELTGKSTTNIATAIQGIQADTEHAVVVMQSMDNQVSNLVAGSRSTSEALGRIAHDAEKANDIALRIKNGAAEQNAAVEAVSDSMSHIARSSENTLSSLHVLQETTHNLNELSAKLSEASARISV